MCRLPSAGPRKRVAGMPIFVLARDHRDVGHQRHLEAAAERIAADLAHRDLREAHQVVVEAE